MVPTLQRIIVGNILNNTSVSVKHTSQRSNQRHLCKNKRRTRTTKLISKQGLRGPQRVQQRLDEGEADLNDYLKDPTNPVLCVPGPDNIAYWQIKSQSRESMYGEPGSTRNYWQLSMPSERLTLGMKMHSTAAFLSMP